MKDRFQLEIGARTPLAWGELNWSLLRKRVRNLRQRIFRASQKGQKNQVRSLMKLMLKSQANLLLSIQRVTQINRGKRTPGIDGQVALTHPQRLQLFQELQGESLGQAKPARRIYIPKAKGKRRPLGIPVLKDRIRQAMVKNALEPSWEACFEARSYGFRPGRSTHDAIAQTFQLLQYGRHEWVLDADIQGAFDTINHQYILDTLGPVPGREWIRRWLKAGYLEQDLFHATEQGTPQGGVISPLLANIALHGLTTLLGPRRWNPQAQRYQSYGWCRYADDFLITAKTRAEVEAIVPKLQDWLRARGLQLHPEKTRIVSVQEGFNFLGFHIRRFKQYCLTKPQKEKTLGLLQRLRDWLKAHPDIPPGEVIAYLNPLLKGWGMYYRHGASKAVFNYVDHQVWTALWRWACRRHPKKSKQWVAQKYFDLKRRWRFIATHCNRRAEKQLLALTLLAEIPIVRHLQVKGTHSPDDPTLRSYWEQRRTHLGKVRFAPGSKLYAIASRQGWKCPYCGEHLCNGEEIQQHHLQPVKAGGLDVVDNLQLLHRHCHINVHSCRKA